MEAIVFKIFGNLFRLIGILLLMGALVSTLSDLQKRAFQNKKMGLVSMLQINQQLVGKTRK